jgi:hypothetical protein
MKNDFTISVPSPCQERWSEFIPTEKGRFCGSCQKEVIDFTQWNEDQIKQYFTLNKRSSCGRFRAKQLTTYHEPKPNRSWLNASILAFVLLILSRPTEAQSKRKMVGQEQLERKFPANYLETVITKVTFHGVVKASEDSSAMPGVNVLWKGTSEGTVTDADGKFEITIHNPKPSETLVFSFIGYETCEHQVSIKSSKIELNTTLSADIQVLGDTIVVGGMISTHRYSPRRLWWKAKNIFRR